MLIFNLKCPVCRGQVTNTQPVIQEGGRRVVSPGIEVRAADVIAGWIAEPCGDRFERVSWDAGSGWRTS